MLDAVICEPVRTPIGRMGGSLSSLTAAQLATIAVSGLLERTQLDPGVVGDVVLGHAYSSGEEPCIGRVVALDAGMPVSVPGMEVDRRCASGLQAILQAALQVQTGISDLVIAGGTESMSNAVHYITGIRGSGAPVLHDTLLRGRTRVGGQYYPVPGGMLETAENLRRQYSIGRAEQDALALTSHRRAVAAQASGRFLDEIVPVAVETKRGRVVVDTDEHPRPDTTLDSLGALKAVMREHDEDATVTAGNSSGQNDGAAVCIVTHPAKAAELGLRPLVRLVSWAVAGVPPKTMGIGPVPATAAALAKAGLELSDIDLIEVNEAFAAQVLACTREWALADSDLERVNVNGSGISLGHPIGATGARILATMSREMTRRSARFGLETMCVGGGQGLAAVFETVAS